MSMTAMGTPASVVLPFVWATARVGKRRAEQDVTLYRTFTEALLRRYMRLSMESGRVSSELGQEMFRGSSSSNKIRSFDEVVIFVHDVERCLGRLDEMDQQLISRVSLQCHSHLEAAELLGMSPRTLLRRYDRAIDRLTRIFLEVRMLTPLISCQGAGRCGFGLTC